MFDIEDDDGEHKEGERQEQGDRSIDRSDTEEMASHKCYIVYHDYLMALCSMITPKCLVKGCGGVAGPHLKRQGTAASILWVCERFTRSTFILKV